MVQVENFLYGGLRFRVDSDLELSVIKGVWGPGLGVIEVSCSLATQSGLLLGPDTSSCPVS